MPNNIIVICPGPQKQITLSGNNGVTGLHNSYKCKRHLESFDQTNISLTIFPFCTVGSEIFDYFAKY